MNKDSIPFNNAVPRLHPLAEAKGILRVGQTKIYQLIHEGKLEARKMGSRTMVTGDSISAFIQSLPRL